MEATPGADLPGLGSSLAISFLSLGLVCLLAYLFLRFLARRGLGRTGAGPIRVLARCPLEPRRSVFIVEAAGRCFLIGAGDGAMTLLAEVDRAAVEADRAAAEGAGGPGFAAVLARVLGRAPQAGPRTGTEG